MATFRRWRFTNSDLLPTTINSIKRDEDSEILDTQEQEALVETFERKNQHQNLFWRGIFAAFATAFAFFFLHSANEQLITPWGIKYHALFFRTIKSSQIVLADLAEAVTCTGIALGVVLSSFSFHRHLLRISLLSGLVLSLFWLYYIFRLSEFHIHFLWLAFGTPCLAAICLYVDNVLAETTKDIQSLRASMYHYKRN